MKIVLVLFAVAIASISAQGFAPMFRRSNQIGLSQNDLVLGLARRLLAQNRGFSQGDFSSSLTRSSIGLGQSDVETALARRLLAQSLLSQSGSGLSQGLSRRQMGTGLSQSDLELGIARRLLAQKILAQSEDDSQVG